MPRDLPLANGSMLVNFDAAYQLRDCYFPHIGEENQTLGGVSRLGLWVEDRFTWLSDWSLELRYETDTLVTRVEGRHGELGLRFEAADAVDPMSNVLMRRFTISDETGRERAVRLFVHLDPSLRESRTGNAAYFDGSRDALVFHKGDRYLLLSSKPAAVEFAVGRKGFGEHIGTWLDAEDGTLSNNAAETGPVDGVIRFDLAVPANGSGVAYSWLAAGRSMGDVDAIHRSVLRHPNRVLTATSESWRFWLSQARHSYDDLSPEAVALYRRSLLMVRTQIDNNGAIVAANDGDILNFGPDTYSYVWPRDAALVSESLNLAGYHEAPRRFFNYLLDVLEHRDHHFPGYLLHRYTPTGQVAASWHSGMVDRKLRLPIQEDETALVVHALWHHLSVTGDVELVGRLYREFVRPAADFMMVYRDAKTGLPQPSFDLWEEKYGVFLFTCGAVVAGLEGAARIADAFGDTAAGDVYLQGVAEIRAGVEAHLYDAELGRFLFMAAVGDDGELIGDRLLDSSMAGAFVLGLLPATDPRVVRTMEALRDGLLIRHTSGGIARHGDDYYHHLTGNYGDYQGNPWFISALWYADWLSSAGRLDEARGWIEWCVDKTYPSGVMAEQLDPFTGKPLSVSPLTWSHAAFVGSVERYLAAAAANSNGIRTSPHLELVSAAD